MATLDDAIRQHLELKRKHGADEDELKELEDSAFGPPERPGTGEQPAVAKADAEPVPAPPAGETGDETTVMATEPEPAKQPIEPAPEAAAEPAPPGAEADVTPAERGRQDYPQLQDTLAHEAVPPERVQSTEEQDALEISLFESDDDDEDFDIGEVDLALGDEDDEAIEPESGEPTAEPPPEETAREHEVVDAGGTVVDPDPTDEAVTAEPADQPETAEEPAEEPEQLVDPDPTEEGHDVLEETPEFLKDAPESDEMWFEQDKPQDFDFD